MGYGWVTEGIIMDGHSFQFTQSVYYTPAFNSAIFDGAIRLYFSQSQESAALRIYFDLQEYCKDLADRLKKRLETVQGHIYLLLYPTPETFSFSFGPQNTSTMPLVSHGSDCILGICGPVEEETLTSIHNRLQEIDELLAGTISLGLRAPPETELW